MTKEQFQYLAENVIGITPISNENPYTVFEHNFLIVLNKEEHLYSDVNKWRYKFDFTNGLIERIQVRPYSHSELDVPAHNHYDCLPSPDGNKTVYEYLTDKNGNLLFDIFMMESAIMFIPQPEVMLGE